MGPEGEEAALGGFDRVDATAFRGEEIALAAAWFAQTALQSAPSDREARFVLARAQIMKRDLGAAEATYLSTDRVFIDTENGKTFTYTL